MPIEPQGCAASGIDELISLVDEALEGAQIFYHQLPPVSERRLRLFAPEPLFIKRCPPATASRRGAIGGPSAFLTRTQLSEQGFERASR